MLTRQLDDPSLKHQIIAINVVKYLNTTVSLGLDMKPHLSMQLTAHLNASCAGEQEAGKRSRSGVVVYYKSAVVWLRGTPQEYLSLRSVNADFFVILEPTKAVLWLRGMLSELGRIKQTTSIMQDHSASIESGKGHPSENFKRSKHIEVRYHCIRVKIASGKIMVEKISSSNKAADLLTEVLTSEHIKEANDRGKLVYFKTWQKIV